ncbi:MAG: hypothetical protein ACOYW4_08605 [Bacillota bacterium]
MSSTVPTVTGGLRCGTTCSAGQSGSPCREASGQARWYRGGFGLRPHRAKAFFFEVSPACGRQVEGLLIVDGLLMKITKKGE